MVQRTFQILKGFHVDRSGESYGKGDFITTDKDLARAWPGKFLDVTSPEGTVNPTSEQLVLEKKKSKKLKKKLKLKADSSKKGNLKTKRSEKIVEQTNEEANPNAKKKLGLKDKIKTLEKMGVNETKKYPAAQQKSLVVFKNKEGKFNIATESDHLTPLNNKPLGRARMEKFLTNYSPLD